MRIPRTPTAMRLAAAAGALALALAGGGTAQAAGGHGHGHHHRHHHPHHRHHHHHHRRHTTVRPDYAPPGNHIFHGVSETTAGVADVRHFAQQVGAHPAVVQDFYAWDVPLATGALDRWRQERARGVLSLSTAFGGQPEVITPHQIARGRGDSYLVRDNQSIAASHQIVYMRVMPEMNGAWNPYSAFNADGSARGGHSTQNFVQAWRRIATIVRGGSVASINKRLKGLGMPRLLRAKANTGPVYARNNIHGKLAHPKVAFIWNPQTVSSPAIAANSSSNYWPGRRYVDWVGADIYSKYATPAVRSALVKFQHRYRRYPFAIGEYSPWDNDLTGSFTRWLFHWAEHTKGVAMLNYYRSTVPDSIFDVARFGVARLALDKILNSRRFLEYAPELRPRGH